MSVPDTPLTSAARAQELARILRSRPTRQGRISLPASWAEETADLLLALGGYVQGLHAGVAAVRVGGRYGEA